MGFRIKNNPIALNALRNLDANAMRQDKTLEKISSGLKVVRAADGPATLIMSEQMRSQIKGLEQVIENSEVSIAMVQTTEAYLDDMNTLLIDLRQLAIHAANDGVNDEAMLEADQLEFDNVLDAIDRIAKTAAFGTKNLLDGTAGAAAAVTGKGLILNRVDETSRQTPPEGLEVKVTQLATQSNITGDVALTTEEINAGELLTFTQDGKTAQYQTKRGDTMTTILEQLQVAFDINNMQLDIDATPDGILSVKHQEYGSEHDFQVSSSTEGVLSEVANMFQNASLGRDISGSIGGERAQGKGQDLTAGKGAKVSAGVSVKFIGNEDLEGTSFPEGLAVGAVNIEQNSVRFQLGANQDENIRVSLEAIGTTKLGTGLANDSNFKSLNDIDIRTFQGANDAIELIKDATTKISSIRGELGAIQKNNLESNLRTVSIARENLINSESFVRDANIAEEVANLTRDQVLTNTAMSMLAQANQTPQTVLQLLQ